MTATAANLPADRFGAPPMWMTFLESRAALEYATWQLYTPLLERLPKGDGHPVLVLPGFTAADRSTTRLRLLLRKLGYRTYGWRLGANIGPTPHIVEGLERRVDKILRDNDGRRISLVGWSLGGIFARELARLAPHTIRQVITLGSPFQIETPTESNASPMYRSLSHLHAPHLEMRVPAYVREELPVPATSVYTRADGVVRWHHCLNHDTPFTENVEVFGSHCGLGFNMAALLVVADRLALPEDTWRPFRVRRPLRVFFPNAPVFRLPEAL